MPKRENIQPSATAHESGVGTATYENNDDL